MSKKVRRGLGAALGSVAAIVALALTVGLVTVPDAASATPYEDAFNSRLAAAEPLGKLVADESVPAAVSVATRSRTATVIAPVAAPRTAAASTARPSSTSASPAASAPAAAPASDLATAQAILRRYIGKYPILSGATVTFGDAKGYQAICYYQSGRIVISPTHTRSLETILGHEIWHIIDWRDNGVIDWGENVPPA